MKQIICLWIAFCLTQYSLQAQDLVQKKFFVYNTKIRDVNHNNHEGFIATMDDTSVYLSNIKFALTFENLDLNHLEKFRYNDVSSIFLSCRKKRVTGALIGGVSGMLVGALIGYSSLKSTGPKTLGSLFDPTITGPQGALIGAAIGVGVGSVLGLILSNGRHTYKIHGKKANLDEMRERMIRTLY